MPGIVCTRDTRAANFGGVGLPEVSVGVEGVVLHLSRKEKKRNSSKRSVRKHILDAKGIIHCIPEGGGGRQSGTPRPEFSGPLLQCSKNIIRFLGSTKLSISTLWCKFDGRGVLCAYDKESVSRAQGCEVWAAEGVKAKIILTYKVLNSIMKPGWQFVVLKDSCGCLAGHASAFQLMPHNFEMHLLAMMSRYADRWGMREQIDTVIVWIEGL
eukprot:771065-Pelagomonas_calceolata.AAC.3